MKCKRRERGSSRYSVSVEGVPKRNKKKVDCSLCEFGCECREDRGEHLQREMGCPTPNLPTTPQTRLLSADSTVSSRERKVPNKHLFRGKNNVASSVKMVTASGFTGQSSTVMTRRGSAWTGSDTEGTLHSAQPPTCLPRV